MLAGAVLTTLVVVPTAATEEATCSHGEKKTIEVGIVKAIGCWTQSTTGGQTIDTAAWVDQKNGVDLNGFVLTGRNGGGLQINESTRRVTSVSIASQAYELALVQLNSHNWPTPGLTAMGSPMKLDFVANQNSAMLLEDLHFGSNTIGNALGGLSPVGTIETPVMLEPGGEGSMDLTVELAGIFTLKGKPQSLTIALPTESEEGTKLDGFELKLQEIDAVKFIKINDLEAKYSASKKTIAGSLNISLPMMKEKGFGGGFELENGVLSKLSFSVHGTKIPLGPVGFLTDIAGGFSFRPIQALNFDKYCKSQGYEKAVIVGADHGANAANHWYCQKGGRNSGLSADAACQSQTGNSATVARSLDPDSAYEWQCIGGITSGATSFDLLANASFGADIGAAVPTPFGDIEPVRVDAGLNIGYGGGGLLIQVNGGLSLFRLPIGDAYLIINTNAGVAFGAGVGIGLPSFRNNPNDPFYLGLRVDGWVGKGHYQFSGDGKFALFGARLLEGHGLINDRAIGACWHVLGVPGGAVYQYSRRVVDTFGIGCGLDDYKEQFPGNAGPSAERPRKIQLSDEEKVLTVYGQGAAPHFTLQSADGRVIRTPTDSKTELTNDHFIVINDPAQYTNVVLPDPKGTWAVIPDEGSAPIYSVQAAREAPKEHVRAHLRGKGFTRTLVWNSLNRDHTRLVFTEVLPNGQEIPVLHTGKAKGRKRVKVLTGNEYGKRQLKVTIIHGEGMAQAPTIVDKYNVQPPKTMPKPGSVSANRSEHDVFVKWSGVKGASGYLVEVASIVNGQEVSHFLRHVGPRARQITIAHHPGADYAVARVYALNSDGEPGKAAKRRFLTNPPAVNLKDAAKRSARSAHTSGGAVTVNVQCPENGHCQTRVELHQGGKVLSKAHYQQTPDTFHLVRLKGGGGNLQVVVRLTRSNEQATAKSGV